MNCGYQSGPIIIESGPHSGSLDDNYGYRTGNKCMDIPNQLNSHMHSPGAIWDLWTVFVNMFSNNLFTLFLKSGNQATQNNCHSYLILKVN